MKQRLKTAIVAGAAVLLAGGGIGTSIASANDTPEDLSEQIIKSLEVTKTWEDERQPLVGDRVRIDGVFDSVNKQVKAGDFFTVSLPAELRAPNSTFPLQDDAEITLADCESSAESNTLTCTFNEAAAERAHVKGSFFVESRLVETTEASHVEFKLGSTVKTVTIPGPGGIGRGERGSMPTELAKYGWQGDTNNTLTYEIQIPASAFGPGETITIQDSMSGGLTFADDAQLWIRHYDNAEDFAAQNANDAGAKAGEGSLKLGEHTADYTLNFNADRGGFTFTMPNFDPGKDGVYFVSYTVHVPADSISGVEFTNNATINGTVKTSKQTWKNLAGGDINGPGFGGLLVSKMITGDTEVVSAEQEFTVVATWTDENGAEQTKELTVVPGGKPASIQGLPVDTVVTLTEAETTLENATYEAEFSSESTSVEIAEGAKVAKVTIGDRTQANVLLTNRITDCTPEPTPTPTPTETPTIEPTPSDTTTPEPTEEPTEEPTPEPTEEPTETPTEEPTEEPTPTPTETETEFPMPTNTPTVDPTQSNTTNPEPVVTTTPEQPSNPSNPQQPNTPLTKTGAELPIGLLVAGMVTAAAGFALRRVSRQA